MISKDLIAAAAKPLILSLLAKKESYGYEIIKDIQKISGNKIIWKDGTLYPVLKKLSTKGFIKSEWKVFNNRKRKYYTITKLGLDYLKEEKEQWHHMNSTLNVLWGYDICLI